MQFLQLRMLSQRKGKAAMISVDARIADAELYVNSNVLWHIMLTTLQVQTYAMGLRFAVFQGFFVSPVREPVGCARYR
jgi:hypothetical protein